MKRVHQFTYIIAALSAAICFATCTETKFRYVPTDNIPPSALSVTEIENRPGGARIYFNAPKEADISYVLGEFYYNGELRTARASVYNNYLTVEGLGSTDPVEIKLYLVDHSENRSSAVVKTFTPETPPVHSIYGTLNVFPDFGGITTTWENPTSTDVTLFFLMEDSAGTYQNLDLFASKDTLDEFSIRGLDTVEINFALYIRDKWGNKSDTFKITTVPLYEMLLDKKKFFINFLPGDNSTVNNNRPLSNIWDGNLTSLWHTYVSGAFPQTFTFCLGNDVNAKINRFIMYPRGEAYYYAQYNPRYFQVWGTTELKRKSTDPDYQTYFNTLEWENDWIMLGDYEVVKPSGLPLGQTTNDDKLASDRGFEFFVPRDKERVRYIRFVVNMTWGASPGLHLYEVSLYGSEK